MKRSSEKIYLISLTAILTIPLIFLPPSALAIDYTFTSFDYPGSSTTMPLDISNSGNIVGYYGLPGVDNNPVIDGFLYANGNFTTINYPGAIVTELEGINNSGKIVGHYEGNNSFLYTNGNFTPYPGVIFHGINNSGKIVGWGGGGSFLYANGNFTYFNYPGAGATYANDISNSGDIVGHYIKLGDDVVVDGFLYANGNFTTIDYPGADFTLLYGINDSGKIVGDYISTTEGEDGSFLYEGGSFISLNYPGSNGTWVTGINDSGEIVGQWRDAELQYHGFVASPQVPEPTTMLLIGSGLIGLAGYGRKKFFEK